VTGPGRATMHQPLDPDESVAWAALASVTGVGPVTFGRLVERFGSATAVLDVVARTGPEALLVGAHQSGEGALPRIAADVARAIGTAAARRAAVRDRLHAAGVEVIALADARYPGRLRRVDSPPPVLFIRGASSALDRPRAVAIVGTRRPTEAGRLFATRAADAIAGRGATVVSGLAYGIDAAAHAASLRAGTQTVAVIGGGHAQLYPAAHRRLADAIVAGGGTVVSEFGPDVSPSRGTFPRRNRIISGLADATVVVEAGIRSGALTTAAWALEQGRSLYLVPGRPGDPAVAGNLAFLREVPAEARIVADVPGLLEDLGLLGSGSSHPGGDGGTAGARVELDLEAPGSSGTRVARALAAGAETVDSLVTATGLTPAGVLAALTVLELRGLVVGSFGRYRAAGQLAAGGRGPARVAARPRR